MGKVVLLPESGRFDDCAGEFVRYWEKTTSEKLPVVHSAAGHEELIIFGADAENPLVHQVMLDGALPRLAVRHGSDDYRIRSFETKECRGLLILGGNIRAYFYAVLSSLSFGTLFFSYYIVAYFVMDAKSRRCRTHYWYGSF